MLRIKVEINDHLVTINCEIPTQNLEKCRKYVIWFTTVSLPLLISYSTAIKFLPPEQLPPLPPNNQEELQK